MEDAKQIPGSCPICEFKISEEQTTIACDWCGTDFHDECEVKEKQCPNCGRFLPTAKMKALASDKRSTSVLIIVPFIIIEIIIAVISWLGHPSNLSVPDLDNWISVGLVANAILLIVAVISMGAVAARGEGVKKPMEEETEPDEEEETQEEV
ncbi:MAG: hypothetical protein JSV43_08610 [Methanobacteriota archaeon]|nr:MAG: hypothetical protein JSV43_08610 [Euryarchaeota archaeon]